MGGSTGGTVSVTGTGSGEHSQPVLVKDVPVSRHLLFFSASSNLASPLLEMFSARARRR